MTTRIATYISVVGHPLLTIPLFVVSLLFRYQDFGSALLTSALLVFGIVVPLTVKMYRGQAKGAYTNFDVSDREQRKSWYFFTAVLLAATIVVLFITNQARAVRYGFLLASQILNYYIKSSLHVAFNIFLAFLIMPYSSYAAAGFLLFVCLIAWSRVYLKRHTTKEIISGAITGFLFGLLLLLVVFGWRL